MRGEDPRAIAELYRRFAPLLRRRAMLWHVGGASCDEIVDDVLADAALALMRPGADTPRSLAAYLLVALRHRLAAARRAAGRREREELDAAEPEHALARPTPTARVAERHASRAPTLAVVRAGISTYSLRAADACAHAFDAHVLDGHASEEHASDQHPFDASAAPLHPVLARLSAELDAGLREQDRLLLAWLADHVPMRMVAAWLGIGYDAALKRASRLRARLRAAALAHTDALPPGERRVVHAFLGRAQRDAPGDDASARSPGETGA